MTAALTAEYIRQRLADLPEVMPDLRLLVLFGSAARDRARSESDIDLAVQCDWPADRDALYLAIASRLGTDRLDLIDLRRAGPLLGMAVARTGRWGSSEFSRQTLRARSRRQRDCGTGWSTSTRRSTMRRSLRPYIQAVESHLTKAGL